MAVREVAARPTIARVPDSDRALAGLCHLRNEFLPVLSLHTLLTDDGEGGDSETQMLVLAVPSGSWALLVDGVESLEPLDVSINTDCRSDDAWSAAMVGSATWRGQVIRVLDPNALYRLATGVLAVVANSLSDNLCGADS